MHNYKSPWKYGVHKYCDKYHAACELAKSSISKEVGMWEESRIRIPENNFVHSHKSYKSQILWQESGGRCKYHHKGDSVRVNWAKVAASATPKECSGRNPDSWRSMFLLLPTHPLTSFPSLYVRGWVSKGSIATGSKFLQLMDLCLRISHLNLLQIHGQICISVNI